MRKVVYECRIKMEGWQVENQCKRVLLASQEEIRFSLYRKPNQAAEYFLEPAEELLHYLQASLGREIPERDESRPVKMLLHLDFGGGFNREEFEICVGESAVVLRSGTVKGMFHAVYYFLETWLGIRWLWPGKSGEVIPKRPVLEMNCGTIREQPDYDWRSVHVGGAIYGALDYNSALQSVMKVPLSARMDFELWHRRNRLGGLSIADGHRWSEIAPAEQYGESCPEMFALVDGRRDCIPFDGKHRNQPCLTHPHTVQRMKEYTLARLAAEPQLDVFSLGLNDGGSSCECKRCHDFDRDAKSEDVHAIEHFDAVTQETEVHGKKHRSITDRVIWNANQVARAVKQKYPGRMLLTLLYSHFRRAPVTHRLEDNVIGQFCIMGCMFWNHEVKQIEMERLKNMGDYVDQLGIYEYYSNGAWPEIHRLYPALVQESVRGYYDAGARYFSTQPSEGFSTNGLNFYVLSKMLWNVKNNEEDITRDFCQSGFGRAAEEIREYLTAFAIRWRDTCSGMNLDSAPEPRLAYAQLYDRAFIADRAMNLCRAREIVQGDGAITDRIDFLQKGLEYTRLYCEALEETWQLYRACDARNFEQLKGCVMPRQPLSMALRAWEAYWYFVKEHMGQFVFGDYWVNYRPGLRGANDATLMLLRERGAAAGITGCNHGGKWPKGGDGLLQ